MSLVVAVVCKTVCGLNPILEDIHLSHDHCDLVLLNMTAVPKKGSQSHIFKAQHLSGRVWRPANGD